MNKIDDVKVTMDTVICEFLFDKNSAETSKPAKLHFNSYYH